MPPRTTAESLPMKKPLRWFALLLFTLVPALASAQQQGLEIDIICGNASALPITVVPMPYQGSAAAPPTDVSAVVRADLETGRIDFVLATPQVTGEAAQRSAAKLSAKVVAQPAERSASRAPNKGTAKTAAKPDHKGKSTAGGKHAAKASAKPSPRAKAKPATRTKPVTAGAAAKKRVVSKKHR